MPVNCGQRLQAPPSEFSTYFSDAPADQSQEVLEIASGVGPGLALSEHGPCLVGGTVTRDDVSFTTKLQYIAEGTPYRCVALLDTDSPQTFIRRNVLDRMLLAALYTSTGLWVNLSPVAQRANAFTFASCTVFFCSLLIPGIYTRYQLLVQCFYQV